MEFVDLIEFFKEYLVVVIVLICLCIGYIIKHAITTDKINKFIPLIMAVLGVALNVWMNLAFTPVIFLEGLASGIASTGLHQAFKQLINKNKVSENEVSENE